MRQLLLRHLPGTDPPRFQPIRGATPEDTSSGVVTTESPYGFPVAGRPRSDLMTELRWYLEQFLSYPFPPETEHVERVLDALRRWGETAFRSLAPASLGIPTITSSHEPRRLRIQSDDPRILSWPWEALRDSHNRPIGQTTQIERSVATTPEPLLLPAELPTDRINVLLVTARPEDDVTYRSISRALVELVAARQLPAHVHVLRPPTSARLREHLAERPATYHVLHFDGHGVYTEGYFGRPEGHLLFEDEAGRPDYVPGRVLGGFLRSSPIPIVVLNACQSAMLDANAEDAFASVAAALIRNGARSVVAMAYSLNVSGAQQFLPAFYGRLFETGSVAESVLAGRRRMADNPGRICARGRFDLEDWLLPVLYQQAPVDLSFAVGKPASEIPETSDFESEPLLRSFYGRDDALLRLERAFRKKPATTVLHGLGGVGKTTLAKGLVDWLRATDGLGEGCSWLDFRQIHGIDSVLNRLAEPILGKDFALLDRQRKIASLAKALRDRRRILVWDNFESAVGDIDDLSALLQALHGGQSKVLVTSRSDESKLGERQAIRVDGLRGDERWELWHHLLETSLTEIDRDDRAQVELMDLMAGHPLAMRVMVSRLAECSPSELTSRLRSAMVSLEDHRGEDETRLFATLQQAQTAVPEKLRGLLVPLALFVVCVDARFVDAMAREADAAFDRPAIDKFLAILAELGLLSERGSGVFVLHPVLGSFLRATILPHARAEERRAWTRAFVVALSSLAQALIGLPLHRQRPPFRMHRANMLAAVGRAERLGIETHQAEILQALAMHAEKRRDFVEAEAAFEELSRLAHGLGNFQGEAGAYHHLGRIAEARREYAAAESWYRKALAINEELNNEADVARTYHHLGSLAEDQRDFTTAERWYRKSLTSERRRGDEDGAGKTLFQLGRVAREQGHIDDADRLHREALAIFKKAGNTEEMAKSFHALGMVAEERRDLEEAHREYQKALILHRKHGNEHGAAITCHELGILAQEQDDFESAEKWFLESVRIHEEEVDEHGAALTYHQLGIIAGEKEDLEAAQTWFEKSLQIHEKVGDEHGAAMTHAHLGLLAGWREDYEECARWLLRSIRTFRETGDKSRLEEVVDLFAQAYQRAPEEMKERLREMWEDNLED